MGHSLPEHQLAFSILKNFPSSVPRLPQPPTVSQHHLTHNSEITTKKTGGITPARLYFRRYI